MAHRAHHHDPEPPLPQLQRNDQGIPPVVARAGDHQHGFAAVAGNVAGESGRGKSGALHQGRRVPAAEHGVFELAQIPHPQYRRGVGEVIHGR